MELNLRHLGLRESIGLRIAVHPREMLVSRKTQNLALGLIAGAAAAVAYTQRVRPWLLRWGATSDVLEPNWPADDYSRRADNEAIRSVTIHAPAADVWPWLVQIGQDRGGFYSYTWLENLAGCEMRNAGRILPAYQRREVGDTVWLTTPDRYEGKAQLTVAYLDPERAMALMPPEDAEAVARGGESLHGFWAFELHPLDDGACRLVMRSRNGSRPTRSEIVAQRLFWEPAHFVMERKMMLTIKRLAERRRPETSDE